MRRIGEIHFIIEPYNVGGSMEIMIEGDEIPPPATLARMIGEMLKQAFTDGQEERTVN